MPTKIEWCARPGTTPESWNPVTGCDMDGKRVCISPGCDHCWAERMARRLAGRFGYPQQPHHFDVTLHPERLEGPLHWRKPRTVFVCSMGDLFHSEVEHQYRAWIFDLMADMRLEQHTFLLLTKRPKNIHDWEWWMGECWPGDSPWNVVTEALGRWPENIWLGVTVENQEAADERIPILLQTPAVMRFVSCEPLLEPVDLFDVDGKIAQSMPERSMLFPADLIDWVIVGGESGPGARPMHPDWVRSIRDQCRAAGVPFLLKKRGKWQHSSQVDFWPYVKGGRLYEWPDGTVSVAKHKRQTGWELDCREWNEWPG